MVAVDAVDLEVAPGEFVALVGPNGSGKSTLLALAAGVDRPTSGSILTFGNGPEERTARRRSTYLADGVTHPPELLAAQALRLVARLRSPGTKRRELNREVDAMLERVGLGHAQRTPLGGFSRGMGRRFGLAQAFLGTPDLVLLDEPSAGLDAPGFPILAELIDESRARSATLVVASHVATDFVEHCDRLVLLERGRVARNGSPALLLQDPARSEIVVAASREGAVATAAKAADTLTEAGFRVHRARAGQRSLVELYEESSVNQGDAETPRQSPEQQNEQ